MVSWARMRYSSDPRMWSFMVGSNLSEGCFDEKMVEGSEGGFNSEVVHWDAGKNHVDP